MSRMSLFPFHKSRRTLLLGEGNFSFARSLAELVDYPERGLTATAYEAEERIHELYSNAEEMCSELQRRGAVVLFGIDATALEEARARQSWGTFHLVNFNFPHIGRQKIHENRNLLSNFFSSVTSVVQDHSIVSVALCKGQGGCAADPQMRRQGDHWAVMEQAATGGFILGDVRPFETERFAHYVSTGRRSGDVTFNLERSVRYSFLVSERVKPNPTFSLSKEELLLNRESVTTPEGRTVASQELLPRLWKNHLLLSGKESRYIARVATFLQRCHCSVTPEDLVSALTSSSPHVRGSSRLLSVLPSGAKALKPTAETRTVLLRDQMMLQPSSRLSSASSFLSGPALESFLVRSLGVQGLKAGRAAVARGVEGLLRQCEMGKEETSCGGGGGAELAEVPCMGGDRITWSWSTEESPEWRDCMTRMADTSSVPVDTEAIQVLRASHSGWIPDGRLQDATSVRPEVIETRTEVETEESMVLALLVPSSTGQCFAVLCLDAVMLLGDRCPSPDPRWLRLSSSWQDETQREGESEETDHAEVESREESSKRRRVEAADVDRKEGEGERNGERKEAEEGGDESEETREKIAGKSLVEEAELVVDQAEQTAQRQKEWSRAVGDRDITPMLDHMRSLSSSWLHDLHIPWSLFPPAFAFDSGCWLPFLGSSSAASDSLPQVREAAVSREEAKAQTLREAEQRAGIDAEERYKSLAEEEEGVRDVFHPAVCNAQPREVLLSPPPGLEELYPPAHVAALVQRMNAIARRVCGDALEATHLVNSWVEPLDRAALHERRMSATLRFWFRAVDGSALAREDAIALLFAFRENIVKQLGVVLR